MLHQSPTILCLSTNFLFLFKQFLIYCSIEDFKKREKIELLNRNIVFFTLKEFRNKLASIVCSLPSLIPYVQEHARTQSLLRHFRRSGIVKKASLPRDPFPFLTVAFFVL